MNVKVILDTIFEYHDDLSYGALFMDKEEDRRILYTKVEAIWELLEIIKSKVSKSKQDQFDEFVEAHYSAFSKSIFYKRRLDLEE